MAHTFLPFGDVTMAASTTPAALPAGNTLEAAFKALEQYQVGAARGGLVPIDQAVIASLGNADVRTGLEQRLVALLARPLSNVAREYICAQLRRMGTVASVPALAGLLGDQDLAEPARSALEAIPDPAASNVLRNKLSEFTGNQRIGVIQSLGARRDRESVPVLAPLLQDTNREIASAAAAALGRIGTVEAAQVLDKASVGPDRSLQLEVVADARLACAEALLRSRNKNEASAIYKSLAGQVYPPHVQLAAKRGLLLLLQQK